jgi:4a-hydroxytetrahydrobiopterin dehydratase
MPRPPKLSPADIAEALLTIPAWKQKNSHIERTIVASSFSQALAFMVQIGVSAEVMDHHPDMLLHGWNKITITLSTHDQGGLTELDFALAKRVDAIVF